MKTNTVKQKLHQGKPTFGTWLSLANAHASRVLARSGFDWLTLDLEHTPTDWSQAATIFAAVAELELAEVVHFLENVSDEDLARLYNAARCLALPSHYEGFGLPPLEAMACGTPVVVSNRSSLPEIVGDAGLLINPDRPEELAEALARILDDDELQSSLRQRGLARSGEFSWTKTARETLQVYEQVYQAALA